MRKGDTGGCCPDEMYGALNEPQTVCAEPCWYVQTAELPGERSGTQKKIFKNKYFIAF